MKSSVHELIKRRYSCRGYIERPSRCRAGRPRRRACLARRPALSATVAVLTLLAITPDDRAALKGLGTYGFIKGATGFLLGAVKPAPTTWRTTATFWSTRSWKATDLGLGTCWLGGTFTKSSFARKIDARPDEVVPAVIAAGYPTETSRKHWLRPWAGANAGCRRRSCSLTRDRTRP